MWRQWHRRLQLHLRPLRLRGRLAWVYRVDPLSKIVRYRMKGSPFQSDARYGELREMHLPEQDSVKWDGAADTRELQRARYVDPKQLPEVAPDLLDEHWPALVAAAQQCDTAPPSLPNRFATTICRVSGDSSLLKHCCAKARVVGIPR